MISVRGTFQDGVARPAEPVHGLDGRAVIITFLEEDAGRDAASPDQPEAEYDPAKDSLLQLIERCQVDSGIGDLAHQHDHYLYGTPKQP